MADTPPAVALLRSWLRLQDMTQGELAKALGCSRALVEAWMSGRRRPSYEKAMAIATLSVDAVPVGSWAYPERIRTDGIDV